MSARNVLESQQSVPPPRLAVARTGCWKLATGQPLSLRPNPMACCRSPGAGVGHLARRIGGPAGRRGGP